MKRLRASFLSALLSAVVAVSASATILNVPDDHETIAAAVASAEEGDTVLVQPGVYPESVDFDGKNITLASLYLTTDDEQYLESTVIDPQRVNRSGVLFTSGETEDALLTGFTIQNAQTDFGGGVYIRQSSPTVRKMLFRFNHAEEAGGGLYVTTNASPLIEDCEFINNDAADVGGGLACYGNSTPTLRNLYFTDNTAASYGGGLYANGSSLEMSNLTVQYGEAGRNGGGMYFTQGSRVQGDHIIIRISNAQRGGGMCVYNQASVQFTAVELDSNTAAASGGGVLCSNSSSLVLNDAVVTHNRTTDIDNGTGGAFYCNEDAAITLTDAVVAFNESHYSSVFHQLAGSLALNNVLIHSNNCNPSTTTCILKGRSEFVNATITRNIRPIAVDLNAGVTFRNCILWNAGILEVVAGDAPGNIVVSVSYTDFDEGERGIADSDSIRVDWGDGNLNADPLFVDPDSLDFHLTAASPCIDAGSPDDEPDTDGSPPDLGALPFLYGTVEGLIHDAANGEPVEGCTLTNGTDVSAVSDGRGFYRFRPVGVELFDLTAVAAGYNAAVSEDLQVDVGEVIEVDFNLVCGVLSPSVENLTLTLRHGDEGVVPFLVTNTGVGELSFTVKPELSGDNYAEPWADLLTMPVSEAVQDTRIYGAVFTGDRFFVAGDGNNNPRFYIFDRDGGFVESLPQPHCEGLSRGMKDLDWDGQLLWGSINDSVFGFTPDLETMYSFPMTSVGYNYIACNPHDATIWLTSITAGYIEFTYDGELVREIPRLGVRNYGLTYWAEDPDGCPLYVNVHPVNGIYWLYKINPETGEMMTVEEAGSENVAEGLGISIATDYLPYNWTLLRVVNSLGGDFLEIFELAGDTHWMSVAPDEGALASGGEMEMLLRLNAGDLAEGDWRGNLAFNHPNGHGVKTLLPIALTVEPDRAPTIEAVSNEFTLTAVYPNPFNSAVQLRFGLDAASEVEIGLYEVSGRLVQRVFSGRLTAGEHTAVFDGSALSSGVYIVSLRAGERASRVKITLVK